MLKLNKLCQSHIMLFPPFKLNPQNIEEAAKQARFVDR